MNKWQYIPELGDAVGETLALAPVMKNKLIFPETLWDMNRGIMQPEAFLNHAEMMRLYATNFQPKKRGLFFIYAFFILSPRAQIPKIFDISSGVKHPTSMIQ